MEIRQSCRPTHRELQAHHIDAAGVRSSRAHSFPWRLHFFGGSRCHKILKRCGGIGACAGRVSWIGAPPNPATWIGGSANPASGI